MSAFSPGRRPRWLLYTFALAITLSTVALRLSLSGGPDERPMLILFMLPVILSALFGGLGPGLLATAVSAMSASLLLPGFAVGLRSANTRDWFQLTFLVINGVAVSLLSEVLRRSRRKADFDRRLLDAVVAGTSDAVFVKDLQGRYLLANAATARFIGQPESAIVGRDDRQLFSPASAAEVMAKDREILAADSNSTHEERVVTQDGRDLVFLVTKGPLRDSQGQALGLFGISRDITARKQAEAALLDREQRLTRVVEASNQGYWDWNLIDHSFQVSARYETMLGYQPGEMDLAPENWAAHVHPEDLPLARASIARHLAGETPRHELELRCRTKAGAWRWIRTSGRVVERDAAGRPAVMSGTHTDVTEQRLLDVALREASSVFASSFEGIMVLNAEQHITRVNPSFCRITGYSAEEVIGQTPRLLSSGQHGAAFYDELWGALRKRDFWRGEIWNRRKNGEVYAELLSISVVRDSDGHIQHYIGVFSDISQLKSHEAELDRIAHFDPLTGLPNRRLLADRLGQAIIHADRNGKSLGVGYLDLDGFKSINDRHGHAVGDRLLIGVTENLKRVLRADDTLARLGGDEFVLLLSDIGSLQHCYQVLDRLLSAVRQPIVIDENTVSVSASVGVSLYPEDRADADTLLRHADHAMYLAKEAGKNRFHLFDPEGDRQAQQHRSMLDRLQQAMAHDELVLHYQPKVDLSNGAVVGAEALIRWQHPEKGLLAPGEFLHHVHGSVLERTLGEWVIETALAQAQAWIAQGMVVPVSVNISADHLLQADFSECLRQALYRHPAVAAGDFELEVLETVAIADMERAIGALQRCRQLGVRFALDDFGTGYSSLTYLRRLPVDTLKIDQSFVRDMLNDADDLGIVEGVVRLAGAFRREVIAEGVETLAHGAALLRLGCRLAQGYGVARPMPAAELAGWSQRWMREGAWRGLHPAAATAHH